MQHVPHRPATEGGTAAAAAAAAAAFFFFFAFFDDDGDAAAGPSPSLPLMNSAWASLNASAISRNSGCCIIFSAISTGFGGAFGGSSSLSSLSDLMLLHFE